ncbi:MAG: hypothetical protein AAEJ47_05825 [Planctomycetota bacterium]
MNDVYAGCVTARACVVKSDNGKVVWLIRPEAHGHRKLAFTAHIPGNNRLTANNLYRGAPTVRTG